MSTEAHVQEIDFTGLSLRLGELNTTELTGAYSASRMADLFFTTWIPYLACEKCGRNDYCKFTKPDPYGRPGRLAEIQCGVLETVIQHYVGGVFGVLQGRIKDQLQAWLEASYFFVQFVYQAELHIGRMLDEDHLKWWGTDEYRAVFFGWTAKLRGNLDRFAALLGTLPEFSTTSYIVLTEGQSEKAFLERMKRTRLLWFLYLNVESYYGKGNRHPTKLLAMAHRLRDQGYRLFIQGDGDGHATDTFNQLVKQQIVEQDDTYSFSIDFESAFSSDELFSAISLMGLIGDVKADDFRDSITSRPAGTAAVPAIEKIVNYGIDKVELAEALADVLVERKSWHDDQFWSTEIGQFLDKLRRLPI